MSDLRSIKSTFTLPFRIVFLMWLIYYIQDSAGVDLGFLGINPRSFDGLIGIITGPMVHGTTRHLVSNTFPLIVLGGLLFWYYPKFATRVFWQSYLFTGMMVWIFARPFYHIGSSGLVYALGFFLVFLGLLKRDFKTLLISLLVVGLYGGIFTNVFFIDNRISWESHLLGAVTGAVQAVLIKYTVATGKS